MIFFDVDGTLLSDEAALRVAIAAFHDAFREELNEEYATFQIRWRALLDKWLNRFHAHEIGETLDRTCLGDTMSSEKQRQ